MTQSKLYLGLSILSKTEIKSLLKFILIDNSKSSDNYQLLEKLIKKMSDKSVNASKDEFRQKHFPKMSSKAFLNMLSRVFSLYEEWLFWHEIKKDENQKGITLVKTYNRRGQFDLANKRFKKEKTRLESEKEYSLYKTESLRMLTHYHYFSENPTKEKHIVELLESMLKSLLHQFQNTTYLYLAEVANRQRFINIPHLLEIESLINMLRFIPESKEINILKNIYEMMSKEDMSCLKKLVKSLKNEEIKQNSDLEVFTLLYCITFLLHHWNKSTLKEKNMVFDIYNYGLSSGVLLSIGKISSQRFINMISVISITKNFKNAYDFIDKWSHLVPQEERNQTYEMSQMYVLREEGKYGEILIKLRQMKFVSLELNNRALSFELKALYKLDEFELLSSKIHNFKRRIKRLYNKGNARYKGYANFILAIEKLAILKHKNILFDINELPNLYHKVWLTKELETVRLLKHNQ